VSLPARPIQPPPQGLLSLLQVKNMGVNPDTLNGSVQPVLDLMPLYLLGQVQGLNGYARPIAAATPSSFAALQLGGVDLMVPAGQQWWVDNYSMSAATGAGATVTGLRLAYQNFNGMTFVMDSPEVTLAALSNRLLRAGGFWLPPGSVIGFYWDAVTTLTANFALVGLQYVPIDL